MNLVVGLDGWMGLLMVVRSTQHDYGPMHLRDALECRLAPQDRGRLLLGPSWYNDHKPAYLDRIEAYGVCSRSMIEPSAAAFARYLLQHLERAGALQR